MIFSSRNTSQVRHSNRSPGCKRPTLVSLPPPVPSAAPRTLLSRLPPPRSPAPERCAPEPRAHPTAAPWAPGRGRRWAGIPLRPPRPPLHHLSGLRAAASPPSQHGCPGASAPAGRGHRARGKLLLERTRNSRAGSAPPCGAGGPTGKR